MQKFIIKIFFPFVLMSCKKEKASVQQDNLQIDTPVLIDNKKESIKVETPKTVYKDSLKGDVKATITNPKKSNPYKEYSFYNNHLKIKIPVSFNVMDKKYVKAKYPTINADIAIVYSNNDGTISILFERSNSPLQRSQLPNIKNQISQSFSNIPEIDLQNATVKKINNKDFVVVEFTSEAIDSRLYNLMFITDVEGKTFTGTFNCTVDYLTEWKPKAQEILNSVTVK